MKRKKYLQYKAPVPWKSGKIPTPKILPAKLKSKSIFDRTPEFVARLKKELKTDVLGF